MNKNAKLVATDNKGQALANYDIKARLVIGRDRACDVRVSHRSASRTQAVILLDENGMFMLETKFDSTCVNGKPVIDSILLKNGDVIDIFENRFIFREETVPPESTVKVKRSKIPRRLSESGVNSVLPKPTQQICEAVVMRLQSLKGKRFTFRKLDNPFMAVVNKRKAGTKRLRNKSHVQLTAHCAQLAVDSFANGLEVQGVDPIQAYSTAIEVFMESPFGTSSASISAAEFDSKLTTKEKEMVAEYSEVLLECGGIENDQASLLAADAFKTGVERCKSAVVVTIESNIVTPTKQMENLPKRQLPSHEDRQLVQNYADEIVSYSGIDEAVAFGVALDSFLADPVAFRNRTNSFIESSEALQTVSSNEKLPDKTPAVSRKTRSLRSQSAVKYSNTTRKSSESDEQLHHKVRFSNRSTSQPRGVQSTRVTAVPQTEIKPAVAASSRRAAASRSLGVKNTAPSGQTEASLKMPIVSESFNENSHDNSLDSRLEDRTVVSSEALSEDKYPGTKFGFPNSSQVTLEPKSPIFESHSSTKFEVILPWKYAEGPFQAKGLTPVKQSQRPIDPNLPGLFEMITTTTKEGPVECDGTMNLVSDFLREFTEHEPFIGHFQPQVITIASYQLLLMTGALAFGAFLYSNI